MTGKRAFVKILFVGIFYLAAYFGFGFLCLAEEGDWPKVISYSQTYIEDISRKTFSSEPVTQPVIRHFVVTIMMPDGKCYVVEFDEQPDNPAK